MMANSTGERITQQNAGNRKETALPVLTGDYATDQALWNLSLILREIANCQSSEITPAAKNNFERRKKDVKKEGKSKTAISDKVR